MLVKFSFFIYKNENNCSFYLRVVLYASSDKFLKNNENRTGIYLKFGKCCFYFFSSVWLQGKDTDSPHIINT